MIYAVIAVCMSISLLLSFWFSHKFTSSRLRLFFFLVASFVGVVLFPVLSGLLIVFLPDQHQSILAAIREQTWTAIGCVVAMAYFGMWRLPRTIAEENERRRDRQQIRDNEARQ